jgi:hypothetical protein
MTKLGFIRKFHKIDSGCREKGWRVCKDFFALSSVSQTFCTKTLKLHILRFETYCLGA